MVPLPRAGSFSPNPAQALQTGSNHSPHPSHTGVFSAGASPSTSSPTGASSLTKIAVAQVYLLLSTIKEDKDRAKWELQLEQLRRLIDENGMEVFTKYFTRLVVGNAPQIFPGLNRPVANPGNYHILVKEMVKIAVDPEQATKIAESIESGTEDIFRDFDLSTFMEHFKLDPFMKTLLALAIKMGSRADLKTKADAILSANFSTFVQILEMPTIHQDLTPDFMALVIDRFLQYHPPSFTGSSRRELRNAISKRYTMMDTATPSQVLAALDLARVLIDKPTNALARYIQKTGADVTRDEESCLSHLQARHGNFQLTPEQVSSALTFVTITQTPEHNPSVLVAALRRIVAKTFEWNDVVGSFDQPTARITSAQFLRLYKALLPVAEDPKMNFDIQRLWGGTWSEPEAQLSFVSAYASLTPEQLDATTIPNLQRSINLDDYANSPQKARERAAVAIRHPLVSVAALSAIFNSALSSMHSSQSIEAKRLFQNVVVPNIDIFLVTAFEISRTSWPDMAAQTLASLFDEFLYRHSTEYEFVLDSLWRKDKDWVCSRLADAHAGKPNELPVIFEHAVHHDWLDTLVYLGNGFALDLAALAHAEGYLDLSKWAKYHADQGTDISRTLAQFLVIKANFEIASQRPDSQPNGKVTTSSLQVRTVSALLQILEDLMPKAPVPDLIVVQRQCITAYPRLINYGEGYDDIIDANSAHGNGLPTAANTKMEEHYKRMYGDEIAVRNIVDVLERYKHSRDMLDQDVFACMIHGLFEEYIHYVDYPLEALATTAVLFGGIISHKLISDLPLKIGLGMVLEAVRDHTPDKPMYKFGLQALMQLLARFREWPGFCKQLLQVPDLQGTDAYKKAEEIIREHEDDLARGRGSAGTPHALAFATDALANGNDDLASTDRPTAPFMAICFDPVPPGAGYEDPDEDEQGKIQFVLNNITEQTLESMCLELRDMLDRKHQQWFASHLVAERAKMQPNYHHVYLDLVKFFEDPTLWSEVLRETYFNVARMLNSEATLQNSTERTQLKNLGGWLGLLTLARDRPIKSKNIAFKQLLIEAHDTKRLIVVIPFVCKVLLQGANSTVFRPPNPWLMDIIYLLIELYHHAELKLNLKFEIEVLCKGLSLDYKSIEPSGEILNRPAVEEPVPVLAAEQLEPFEGIPLNGLGSSVGAGLSPQAVAPTIPDLSAQITIPPTNEMVVSTTRLHEIVRSSVNRALLDIIQPVVDRSVTIAAISTQQMIRKDFVSEPDENRVRASAINMVKATAGALALVTSKEPLRANMTNYMRNFSNDLPSGLPEGTIIMCVNSNLDVACNIIEQQAEERAVPEIEELLEADFEARRRFKAQNPNESSYPANINRWAMTIPNPFKLSPNMPGLNPEQMAIYEDFARQPRSTAMITAAGTNHEPSASDATRSLANEVLQEPFSTMPNIPTPAETPSLQQLGSQMQPYGPLQSTAGSMSNGRSGSFPMEAHGLTERLTKLLQELLRAAGEAREEHFADLPRPHQVLDVVDALVQFIIKTSQSSEELPIYAAEQITAVIFQQVEDNLTLESLVHVMETLRKISGHGLNNRVRALFREQPGGNFLSLSLIAALMRTDLLDWKSIDVAMSQALNARKEGSLGFLEQMLDLVLLNSRPIALYADFVCTLEAAWNWINTDGDPEVGERLKSKLVGSGMYQPSQNNGNESFSRRDQMEYVFDEWVKLCDNQNTSSAAADGFIQQLRATQVIRNKNDFFAFVRTAIDVSVDRFEHQIVSGGDGYMMIDALAKLIGMFIRMEQDGITSRASFVESVFVIVTLVLTHHHIRRGELLNSRIFFRLISMLLHELHSICDELPEEESRQIILNVAVRMESLGPRHLPGFSFAWLALLQHRSLMPSLMSLPGYAGWKPYSDLVCQHLDFLSEQLNAFSVSSVAKDLYRATLKLLVILQHDYSDFLAAHHVDFCKSIAPHCSQLLNLVLTAQPPQGYTRVVSKGRDTAELESKVYPGLVADAKLVLQEAGLIEGVEEVIQGATSEGIVAQIVHNMSSGSKPETTFGYVPVSANIDVINAVVIYFGHHAAERLSGGEPIAINGKEPEVAVLSALMHEVSPEVRYHLVSSMINQLRYHSMDTEFFTQFLLHVFGKDLHDPEDTDIRQEITRVLLERLLAFWPQPWGLMSLVVELLRNEKYMFFDLPFIKSTPEVAERFGSVLRV
ncbi:CCR4-Not complex component, Not1 [Cordyceps fumosorosea ARSEF 2679]|uniref:General negative regulator of transcription subunit 1 n=1 Tax=Cordyceps fumosorosea (strain ARSEF 2679) TaxID=1081104 RepID=A0A168BT61_CORFA|nr:CCR4-Not complex component, Not1 [Cordyceps fumosorosea ARSEF 2679]OAA70517.1 CCR4-Not complex component, Not1 [Cordyceps fumosorosea ARSEF 2679]